MARRSFYAKGKWADARSINSIITDYKKFVGVVEADCERIMKGAADITLKHTMPFVPRETGALAASARAEAVKTAKGWAGIVSFGGEDYPVAPTENAPDGIVNYAVIVNYDLTKNHPVGEAMFLEKGAMASKGEVDAYIIGELKKIEP